MIVLPLLTPMSGHRPEPEASEDVERRLGLPARQAGEWGLLTCEVMDEKLCAASVVTHISSSTRMLLTG